MRTMRRRTRLLTVRLSDSEYDNLKARCYEEGARSLSDYARDAILQRLKASSSPQVSLAGDLHALGEQLEQVDDALKDLSARIERVLGKT